MQIMQVQDSPLEGKKEDEFVVIRIKKSVRDKLHIYKYKYGFKSISDLLEKMMKTLE